MNPEGVKHRKDYTKVAAEIDEDGGREIPEQDPDRNVNP